MIDENAMQGMQHWTTELVAAQDIPTVAVDLVEEAVNDDLHAHYLLDNYNLGLLMNWQYSMNLNQAVIVHSIET